MPIILKVVTPQDDGGIIEIDMLPGGILDIKMVSPKGHDITAAKITPSFLWQWLQIHERW